MSIKASLILENINGGFVNERIYLKEQEEEINRSLFSDNDNSDDDESSMNSIDSSTSLSSGFIEDNATSSFSSSCSSLQSPRGDQNEDGPLFQMSSLISHLPFKRGLSKHFNGKSQSFTSLANVKILEDLAKPENNHARKFKSKSYGCGLDHNKKTLSQKHSSRRISKKSSKRSSLISSINYGKKDSCLGNKHKRSASGNHPFLFA